MTLRYFLIFTFSIFLFSLSAQQKIYQPNWESLDSRPIPEWFEDAKFGIFIHWGPYSVPAWSPKGTYSEWYQYWMQTRSLFGNGNFSGSEVYDFHIKNYGEDFSYYDFGPLFTNELFDPGKWAKLFERSGAKYIVCTSKHHDGYTMWPNEQANDQGFPWNSMEVGAKRDLLGDLSEAIKKTDIKMGIYYSLYEWFHPWWQKDKARFVDEHFIPQVKDLVTKYKPDILWGDGEWDMPAEKWKTPELIAWMYNESPAKDKILLNDRWGQVRQKHGGYYTTEYESGLELDHPWEECRGMGFSFGYNRAEEAEDYNSAQVLIYMLVDIVSKGGNLLLDIGPKADGSIPVIMQERLLQMGQWLDLNGEAIYGTRSWKTPVQWSEGKRGYEDSGQSYLGGEYILKETINPDPGHAVKEAFFTYKANTLYAISPAWPGKTLILKNIELVPGSRITFLETGELLTWTRKGKDIIVQMPLFDPGKIKSQFAYTIKILGVKDFIKNPKIILEENGFNKPTRVQITCKTKGVKIHYTLDGSEPSELSTLYSAPFEVNKKCTLKVRAFGDDKSPSDPYEVSLRNFEKYHNITLKHQPVEKYSANRAMTLADDIPGELDFGKGHWLGFNGSDFEAVVDLGKKKAVKSVRIGFLHDPGSWIMLPPQVEFLYSSNGKRFKSLKSIQTKVNESDQKTKREFLYEPDDLKTRYIKISGKNFGTLPSWHKSAGEQAWLFVDEILID